MAAHSAKSTDFISNPLDLIKPSFEALKTNINTLLALVVLPILALIAAMSIGMALVLTMGLHSYTAIVLLALDAVLALILLFWLIPATTIIMLSNARGQKIALKEVLQQSRRFIGPMFVLGVLEVLAIMVGLVLFVFPGLFFIAWLSLASYAMVDENLGPIAAMKRSKQLVTGHMAETFGLMGTAAAFSLLTLVPVLGWLGTLALSLAYAPAPAMRYLQLKELGDAKVPVHWANYVMIVLGLLSFGLDRADSSRHTQPDWLKQIDQSITQK